MDLATYMRVIRRSWVRVIVIWLIVLAVAGAVTLFSTPRYTSTTRVFFAVQGGESVSDLAQGSTFAEKQMTSYAEVATSPLVLVPVIEELGLSSTVNSLAKNITVTIPIDTVILNIEVVNEDPSVSANIANTVARQVAKVASGLSPERPDGTEAVRATILASAVTPTTPSSPHVLRNLVFGALLGLVLAISLTLLLDALDTKIRSEHDVEALGGTPILGAISFDADVPDHPVMIRHSPGGAGSEAVRRLRTNLQFVDVSARRNSLVITSSISDEGKTVTALNLAVSLVDAGSRVLLIDADLRRPSVANYLGMEGAAGLTTVLIGRALVEDVVQTWEGSGLDVLPSGQIPPNPSELLGSQAMSRLLEELTLRYDMVLLDSPPLLPVTDAVVLSKVAGGALLVIGADRVHRSQLRDALSIVKTAGVHLVGTLVNKVARGDSEGYGYGYGYGESVPWNTEADYPASSAAEEDLPMHASK